jgi:hypothetical protein
MSAKPWRYREEICMNRPVLTVLVLLLLVTPGWAVQTMQWVIHGTTTTLLTPNTIATGGLSGPSAAYNNTLGSTGNGYTLCRFEAVLNFSNPPNANSAVYLWIGESIDNGTTFADLPVGAVVTGPPHLTMPIASGQAGGATTIRTVGTTRCPPGQFRITVQLSNTGQTTTGSANTIKLQQFTPQANP